MIRQSKCSKSNAKSSKGKSRTYPQNFGAKTKKWPFVTFFTSNASHKLPSHHGMCSNPGMTRGTQILEKSNPTKCQKCTIGVAKQKLKHGTYVDHFSTTLSCFSATSWQLKGGYTTLNIMGSHKTSWPSFWQHAYLPWPLKEPTTPLSRNWFLRQKVGENMGQLVPTHP